MILPSSTWITELRHDLSFNLFVNNKENTFYKTEHVSLLSNKM